MTLKVEKVKFDSASGYVRGQEGNVKIIIRFDGPLLKNGWYVKSIGFAFDWDYNNEAWNLNSGSLKKDLKFFIPQKLELETNFKVPRNTHVGRHGFIVYYSSRMGDLHVIYEGDILIKE